MRIIFFVLITLGLASAATADTTGTLVACDKPAATRAGNDGIFILRGSACAVWLPRGAAPRGQILVTPPSIPEGAIRVYRGGRADIVTPK